MLATVRLDTAHHVGPIDRRIFGGFLEHLGRAVYSGVYDPASRLSDARGFRQDVLEALRLLRMPIIRYPGGNYVSAYDWKQGIGPKQERPRRPDTAWQSLETNQFGTDEFMAWCSAAQAKPLLAVNLGTAGAVEAAQLVEYCNFPAGTLWSDRRRQHGRAEPYDVMLWGLGNEMDGPWQAGHVPADVYAQRAYQASFLMKGLDPRIETVAAGSSGRDMPTYLQWDRQVLEYCWDTVDYISAHRYSTNYDHDSAWFLAEGVEVDRIIEDYAGLLGYVRGVKKSNKQVYLAFDEYNVWYRARDSQHLEGGWQVAPPLLEELYNLEDALVCAQYLAAFVRRADVVKLACLAQIVNVIAPILTRPDDLLRQTSYHAFALFSQHARGVSLRVLIDAPSYHAGKRGEVPVLDACASYDEHSGQVAVFLVNRDPKQELDVQLEIRDRELRSVLGVDLLGGEDPQAANSWEQPDRVGPRPGQAELVEGAVRLRLPAPALAAVRLETVAG
jgi:alpha-N-arabinofuranosidase